MFPLLQVSFSARVFKNEVNCFRTKALLKQDIMNSHMQSFLIQRTNKKGLNITPESVTGVGKESGRCKHGKDENEVGWQNVRLKLFPRFVRVSTQEPCVVQGRCTRDEGNCDDQEDSIDIRHIVYD